MNAIVRHLPFAVPFSLAEQVDVLPGQIVSKTLVQNEFHSLTLFAFDKGEEISTHLSSGDALIVVLEGVGQVTVDGVAHRLEAGQSILMPAQIPHAVLGLEAFKMLLVVVFPTQE